MSGVCGCSKVDIDINKLDEIIGIDFYEVKKGKNKKVICVETVKKIKPPKVIKGK